MSIDPTFAAFEHDDTFDVVASTINTDAVQVSTAGPGRFVCATTARQFIRGGNATFTVRSVKTGTRFTYRVSTSDDGNMHFVGVLNGADNNSNYAYMGIIRRDIFQRTAKSRIAETAPSFVAFKWVWQKLAAGIIPDQLEIWHEGRCGRCNRKLTVPESVASGFGPECIQHIH